MNWILIILIMVAGCAVINPLLYFVYWELYKRKEWIKDKKCWKSDERFWSGEWDRCQRTQIAPIQPQIKDVWYEMDAYWVWWFPVVSMFTTLFYVGSIIARPFEMIWKGLVRKIANLKV